MVGNESIISGKSKDFALRIIKLYSYLCSNKKEYVLSKQILRSGTSIGANVKEATMAQSTFTLNFIYHSKKRRKQNIGWNFYMKVVS